jgi:hypothetical protein
MKLRRSLPHGHAEAISLFVCDLPMLSQCTAAPPGHHASTGPRLDAAEVLATEIAAPTMHRKIDVDWFRESSTGCAEVPLVIGSADALGNWSSHITDIILRVPYGAFNRTLV